MTKPGFVTIGKKKIRAFLDDKGQPIEVYDEDVKAYVIYGKTEKSKLEVLYTMEKETRYICGKTRTCKISNGKIVEVYDDDKKVYVPHDEFLRQQEEYKTNPIVDDTKDEKKGEKKEYYTTHGKKTKETKDSEEDKKAKGDKKLEEQILPKNIATTTMNTYGTSGTIPAIDYMSVPVNVDDSKVDSDRVKITNKKKDDPYDWYIRKILKY